MGGAVTALRIGVVGAGQISGAYLSTLRRLSNVEVVAVCDLDEARAQFGIGTGTFAEQGPPPPRRRARARWPSPNSSQPTTSTWSST